MLNNNKNARSVKAQQDTKENSPEIQKKISKACYLFVQINNAIKRCFIERHKSISPNVLQSMSLERIVGNYKSKRI